MSALVQISDFKNHRSLWQDGALADAINKGRHPLLVELVDELSKMFGHWHARSVPELLRR